MHVGVTLPTFNDAADAAFDVAGRAEAAGLDGVFVFDHLWPVGQPDRPALHSKVVLGGLAVETSRVHVGPLVARVSLLANAVLVHELETLHRMLGDRLVAALGTGDSLNRDENERYGIDFPPLAPRVADLADCCRRLRAIGVRTWVGGASEAVRAVAATEADGWNGWEAGRDTFAAHAREVGEKAAALGRDVELTWGGQVLVARTADEAEAKLALHGPRPGMLTGTVDDVRAHVGRLAELGVTWAVFAPLDVGTDPDVVGLLAEVGTLDR